MKFKVGDWVVWKHEESPLFKKTGKIIGVGKYKYSVIFNDIGKVACSEHELKLYNPIEKFKRKLKNEV